MAAGLLKAATRSPRESQKEVTVLGNPGFLQETVWEKTGVDCSSCKYKPIVEKAGRAHAPRGMANID